MAAAAGSLGRRRLPLRSAPGLQLPWHPIRRPESGRRTTPFWPAIVRAACRPIAGRFGRRLRFPGLGCIWTSSVPRENVGGQCPAGSLRPMGCETAGVGGAVSSTMPARPIAGSQNPSQTSTRPSGGCGALVSSPAPHRLGAMGPGRAGETADRGCFTRPRLESRCRPRWRRPRWSR